MSPGRHWRPLVALVALSLAVRLVTAALLRQPGYTDAYYYAVGARQLDAGEGFTEPFIWNWLNPPQRVSHPGYEYWMPLTALAGWLGLAAFGDSFWAVQAPFVLLSALLPLVAYGLALDLTGQRRHALLAGLLAVFPGFYAHVLVVPDSFAPFALAGSLCLWAAGRGLRAQGKGGGRPVLWFGLAGLAAGLGHLARADGPLLLGVALLAPLIGPGRRQSLRARLLPLAGCVLGYLLVISPWFVRNWQIAGSPLPGAGLRTLFLTSYDDMFAYGLSLTAERYLAWGWGAIVQSKIQALAVNLGRLWAENFLLVLLPFAALGLWKLHRSQGRSLLWPFLLYLPLLFLTMTVAFPFAGMRGGLFHSGGALLPTIFATVGPGLEVALGWAGRRWRNWHAGRSWPIFAAGLVAMAILVTVLALWQSGVLNGEWNGRNRGHAAIGRWLEAEGVAGATVMVGDAPAFTWHTGQPAIAVPNNPLDTIVSVSDRYGAGYLVLDGARPRTTDELYAGRESHPRLALVYTVGGVQLYEIAPP